MRSVWREVKAAAAEAPRIYFAPFVWMVAMIDTRTSQQVAADHISTAATLARIESKLNALTRAVATLVNALAEDEDDEPEANLEGELVPGERDQTQGLD